MCFPGNSFLEGRNHCNSTQLTITAADHLYHSWTTWGLSLLEVFLGIKCVSWMIHFLMHGMVIVPQVVSPCNSDLKMQPTPLISIYCSHRLLNISAKLLHDTFQMKIPSVGLFHDLKTKHLSGVQKKYWITTVIIFRSAKATLSFRVTSQFLFPARNVVMYNGKQQPDEPNTLIW